MRRACVSRSGHCSLIFSLRLMMIITSEDMSYCFPIRLRYLTQMAGDPARRQPRDGRWPWPTAGVGAATQRRNNVLRSRFGEK
jgi:hypothetical protein